MNTKDYYKQYYLKNREKIKQRHAERKEEIAEYQKKYRQKNKRVLDMYHLKYMREKRWLDGSENYSGELG